MWVPRSITRLNAWFWDRFKKAVCSMHTCVFRLQCSAKSTQFRKTCTKCPKLSTRIFCAREYSFSLCTTMRAQDVFSRASLWSILKSPHAFCRFFQNSGAKRRFSIELGKTMLPKCSARACSTHNCPFNSATVRHVSNTVRL